MQIPKYAKFSKDIVKPNKDIIVRHIISCVRYAGTPPDMTYGISKYIHNYRDPKTNKIISNMTIQTANEDHIAIMSGYKAANPGMQDENANKGSYVSIFEKNFYKVERLLDIGKEWLLGTDDKIVFTYDENDNTTGIKSPDICHKETLWQTKFIMIRPSVVFNDVGYQGIALYSDGGLIGNMLAEEYMSFYKAMKGLMNNFYTASLALYNLSISLLNDKESGSIQGSAYKQNSTQQEEKSDGTTVTEQF